MRFIDFTPPNDDQDWQDWCDECNLASLEVCRTYDETGKFTIVEAIYKRLKTEHYFNMGSPYFGKCAYCEQSIAGDQHGSIEHFRPKGGVTDEHDVTVNIDRGGKQIPHPGYYWVAYDWRNLLPSCILCNQSSTEKGQPLGKRNRFPVLGQHAAGPGEESGEVPLLLNPLFDNPCDHLSLVASTGVFTALSDKGDMSIKVLGLNYRNLPDDRTRAFTDLKDMMRMTVLEMISGGDVGARLIRLAKVLSGYEQFTVVQRKAFQEVDATLDGLFARKVELINLPTQAV